MTVGRGGGGQALNASRAVPINNVAFDMAGSSRRVYHKAPLQFHRGALGGGHGSGFGGGHGSGFCRGHGRGIDRLLGDRRLAQLPTQRQRLRPLPTQRLTQFLLR